MDNKIVYKYYRGSFAYGTFIEGVSDMDEGGIYICDSDNLLGIRSNYQEEISDNKHDKCYYELGRYVELLMKGNPTILEGLFVPSRCVITKDEVIQPLFENRDKFITKYAVRSIFYYAESQIKKARGLNKKIVNPIYERKTPIDFCYMIGFGEKYNGSIPLTEFLDNRGYKQKYCGLAHVPNTNGLYSMYYDYEQHIKNEFPTWEDFDEKVVGKIVFDNDWDGLPRCVSKWFFSTFFCDGVDYSDKVFLREKLKKVYEALRPKGYHGVQKEDGSSNDIHMDSIVKNDVPICFVSYNNNGYQTHCRQYKEYMEWVEKRNPVRYESNLDKNYDSKNMMHCIRLLNMAIEMSEGKGMIVDRTGIDSDFLLYIRNHKYEYDYLIDYANKKKNELEDKLKTCTLPETVDKYFVNNLLIEMRNSYYDALGW